jgi:hypothetical protein
MKLPDPLQLGQHLRIPIQFPWKPLPPIRTTAQYWPIRGTSFIGEVLAVRESAIVLAKRFGMPSAEIAMKRDNVIVFPFREVHTVVTEGSS